MPTVPDYAPLWLPHDEATAEYQGSAAPAQRVEGWSWPTMLLATVFGSPSKTISHLGVVAALLAYAVTIPTLAQHNAVDLLQLMMWQGAVVAALTFATRKVRSVSLGTLMIFWLAGLFCAPLATSAIDSLLGLIYGSDGQLEQWIRPILALVSQILPLAAAVLIWPRRWRHPGVTDLLLLGAAIGAGFSMHEDGLWDATRGTEILQGHHLVWVGLIGSAIGLAILERRDERAVIGAAAIALIVVGDMTVLDLRWMPLTLLVAMIAIAYRCDERRLTEVARRDHLFPEPSVRDHDVMVGAYRRLRTGVHTTLAARGEHWPPADGAPIAELARAAKSADLSVGRETSRDGWDRDPDDPTGVVQRFFGPSGWTTFTFDGSRSGQSPTRSRPEVNVRIIDDISRHSIPGTRATHAKQRASIIAGTVLLLAAIVALTMSTDLLGEPTLASAPTGPPLLRTAVGAIGAGAAVIGRSRPALGQAWELGPPDHHEA